MKKNTYSPAAIVLYYSILSLGALILFVPFFWMISLSLKGWQDLPQTQSGGTMMLDLAGIVKDFFPSPAVWENYPKALSTFPFVRYLTNTLFITVMSMIGVLLSNPLIAYGFAYLRAPGKKFIFLAYLGTMMIPGQVTMIPVYILWARVFHAVDTYWPLIIGSFFGSPFYVFLLRQFLSTIPGTLREAAKIDGCSEFGIFSRITYPLLRPAIGVLLIFTFMGQWNDFMGPLIYLNSHAKRTLSLGLAFFSTSAGEQVSMLNYQMVIAFIMTIPCLLLFFFSQKAFIRGIVLRGDK
jgi:multiple sugar transport system permease protein